MLQLIETASQHTDLGSTNLGTHSVCKLADSFAKKVANGPSVKLGAGHSIGKVNDAYHEPDVSSDCFVGRTISLRPMTNARFATLPPHFDRRQMPSF